MVSIDIGSIGDERINKEIRASAYKTGYETWKLSHDNN